MCYPLGDFATGPSDVMLGSLQTGAPEPVRVWMSAAQFEYWSHTHLTIDVVPGQGGGFSLEAPLGVRFLIRSRLLTEEELTALDLGLRHRRSHGLWYFFGGGPQRLPRSPRTNP
jgi:uncharacterized protein (DUF779 family)